VKEKEWDGFTQTAACFRRVQRTSAGENCKEWGVVGKKKKKKQCEQKLEGGLIHVPRGEESTATTEGETAVRLEIERKLSGEGGGEVEGGPEENRGGST